MRSLLTGIALGSVALSIVVIQPATALDLGSILILWLQQKPHDTPTTSPNSKPQPTNSPRPATSIASLEQAVHTQVNQYRARHSLPPLSLDARISEQARTHSQDMASGAVPLSHDGFTQRVQAIATVIPYSGAAENVADNQGYADPATQAVQGWLNSTGHRQNIEGQYNLTGIGVSQNARGEYYFTQIFLTTQP